MRGQSTHANWKSEVGHVLGGGGAGRGGGARGGPRLSGAVLVRRRLLVQLECAMERGAPGAAVLAVLLHS